MSPKKRLTKDEDLREKYAAATMNYLNKGYVIEIPNAHKVENQSDEELHQPHHPVVNPNQSGKVLSVLIETAKIHGASFNKSMLVGCHPLQNLIHVLLRFCQQPYAVPVDIEELFLYVGLLPLDQSSPQFFCVKNPQPTL